MFSIVHELTIQASQDRVFEALTRPEAIARWWTDDVRFGADETDPPVLARLTCLAGPDEWPGTELALTLLPEPDGKGTVLRLWHGRWEYEDGVLPSVSFGWAMHLDGLRRELEGG